MEPTPDEPSWIIQLWIMGRQFAFYINWTEL